MRHVELRRLINRHEYKLVSGEYHSLDLGDTTYYGNSSNTNYAFNVGNYLGFKLFLICACEIIERERHFTITRIIFIDYSFKVHEFDSLESFVSFVPTLSHIEEIHLSK
jgi:hypothetical protein